MSKKLAIYMTYNKDGIVDDYIVYMLKALFTVVTDIIVVCNNKYTEEEKSKIDFASKIVERENDRFDVGAYSQVICELYESLEINSYDELILINDSVFGPVFDLKDMFGYMDSCSELDFWGITKRGKSDFDGGAGVYLEHIQSYFLAFRKSMLITDEFRKYWETIPDDISDFRSAVTNYEFKLTQYFENLGFKWDTYCDCNEYEREDIKYNLSPYHYYTYELIAKKRCPFIKRKLFTGEFICKDFTDASDLKNAFYYIQNYTFYDTDLIWKYILREYDIFTIMESLQMVEVIESDNEFDSEFCSRAYDKYNDLYFYCTYGNKKSVIEERTYNNFIYTNLCANEKYVKRIHELFENEPRLGMLVLPIPTFGENLQYQKNMYNIIGFICRRTLFSQEIINSLENENNNDFIKELPILAQRKGYYTKQIINKNYIATQITNMQAIIKEIREIFPTELKTIKEIKEYTYKEKIKNFVTLKNKIYIYGAGNLAARVLKITESFCKIKGILVSDKNSNLDKISNYDIIQFSEINEKDIDVIIAVGKKNSKTVVDYLRKKGINSYLIIE